MLLFFSLRRNKQELNVESGELRDSPLFFLPLAIGFFAPFLMALNDIEWHRMTAQSYGLLDDLAHLSFSER